MFNLKKASFSLVVATLAATAGAMFSTTAQAAIMGGQISGTWQYDYDGEGGFNVGDAFTADFTYDSDSITTNDYSNDWYDKYLVRAVSLLSLVINSGTISQVFDFSDGSYSSLQWGDVQLNPHVRGYEYNYLYAYDSSTVRNYFYAYSQLSQSEDGSPWSSSNATAQSYDYSTGTYTTRASTTSNVTFSDPFLVPPSEPTVSTPEPTSALLTGLIGLGVIVLHRRKKIEAVAE